MSFKIEKLAVAISLLLLLPTGVAVAQEKSEAALEEVTVLGVRARMERAGLLKDVIEKTELIGTAALESSQAVSLGGALSEAPGADVAIDCSMCGMKRLRLNGLRAEHTNLLIDGLPAHTVVSGFYGLDAVSMTGVQQIEIARGAGASLTAPEAIGGVVNVIMQEAFENGASIELAGGETGYEQANLLGTYVSEDSATRITLIGQYDKRDQADEDGNGVSENPLLDNTTFTARISHDISTTDNLLVRVTTAEQESFGGPVLGDTVSSIGAALASFDQGEAGSYFANDNVNDRWEANPWETTEWVDTARREASVAWLHEVNPDFNTQLSFSYANNDQNSFYEGYHYVADDTMYYIDAHANFAWGTDHFLTIGVDHRDESMESELREGDNTDFSDDSFDHETTGLYIQDSWKVSDKLDIKAALRFDEVIADFTAVPGTEIDETILSPRIDLRYIHGEAFTSRLSAGTGYRAPLSFFESDHGLLDEPIVMDIDDLEQSVSVGYALSYGDSRTSATASIAWTEVENLSYLEEGNVLSQLDEKGTVTATDLAYGFRLTDSLLLNVIVEKYFYDNTFKDAYGIVPVEEAVSVTLDYDYRGWDIYGTISWVGSRDLAAYGYEGFNSLLPGNPGFVDPDSAKAGKSPDYFTVDFRIAKEFGEHWSAYVGANNLFDYTQAGDEDSPLFFVAGEEDGTGIQADGFDVTYIYGPLRGREIYAGVKYEF